MCGVKVLLILSQQMGRTGFDAVYLGLGGLKRRPLARPFGGVWRTRESNPITKLATWPQTLCTSPMATHSG